MREGWWGLASQLAILAKLRKKSGALVTRAEACGILRLEEKKQSSWSGRSRRCQRHGDIGCRRDRRRGGGLGLESRKKKWRPAVRRFIQSTLRACLVNTPRLPGGSRYAGLGSPGPFPSLSRLNNLRLSRVHCSLLFLHAPCRQPWTRRRCFRP